MILKHCWHFMFPSWHQLMNEVLLNIVNKIKEKYVNSSFASCVTCIASFVLWVFHIGHDIFAIGG